MEDKSETNTKKYNSEKTNQLHVEEIEILEKKEEIQNKIGTLAELKEGTSTTPELKTKKSLKIEIENNDTKLKINSFTNIKIDPEIFVKINNQNIYEKYSMGQFLGKGNLLIISINIIIISSYKNQKLIKKNKLKKLYTNTIHKQNININKNIGAYGQVRLVTHKATG